MKVFLAIALLASGASAQALTNTESLSCAAAQALVQSSGSIKLQAGESYGRRPVKETFHASKSTCRNNDLTAVRAFAPTLDNASCQIGYVCRDSEGTEQFKSAGMYKACQNGATKSSKVRSEEQDEFGNAIGAAAWTRVETCINGRWTVTQGNPADAYQACTNGATWNDEIHVKVWDNEEGDERDGRWLGTNIYTCVNGKFHKTFVPRP